MRKNKNKLLYDFDHYKNKKIKARKIRAFLWKSLGDGDLWAG